MCWSLEVSLLTGTVTYAIATYLWLRNFHNDRWHSLILWVIGAIQWMDAIIWQLNKTGQMGSSWDERSPILPLIMKWCIPLILALEPLITLYGAWFMGHQIASYDIILYSIICVTLLLTLIHNARTDHIIGPDGIQYSHGGNNQIGYWIFCALLIYPLLKYNNGNRFYWLAGALIAFTLWLAQAKSQAIGSNWCLYGNVFSLLALFYPYIHI